MLIKDLESRLYPCLEDGLRLDGFRFLKRRLHFYRTVAIGRDSIGFGMHKHGEIIHVSVGVAVRHDGIEELITAVLSKLNEVDPQTFRTDAVKAMKQGDTATIGADLGNIGDGWFKVWQIADESDIEPACAEMIERIHRDAFPFCEQFRSTSEFLEKLARDDRDAWLWAPIHHARARRAVAAAFLLHDRAVFDRIRSDKDRFLEGRGDEFGLRQFRPFAQYLAEHWEDCHTVSEAGM